MGELLKSNIYSTSGRDRKKSLISAEMRTDLGRVDANFWEATEFAKGLGINKIDNLSTSSLRISHANLEVVNFQEPSAFPTAGLAEEISPNRKGEPVVKAIYLRLAGYHFDPGEFAQHVGGIMKYDQRRFKLPRELRGDEVCGVLTFGTAIGSAAVIGFTHGDPVYTLTALGLGAAVGGSYAYCLDKQDQWDIASRVPDLNQYYSNREALKRLREIVNHNETTGVLNEIDQALRSSGVALNAREIRRFWTSDPTLEAMRSEYNFKSDKEQAQFRQDMIYVMAGHIRSRKFPA